jgi:hypothetical protein
MIYIFKIPETEWYYIEEHTNATRIGEMLERYCNEKVERVGSYKIDGDFRKISPNLELNLLNPDSSFLTYFDNHFKFFKHKRNWYKFDMETFHQVMEYLEKMKYRKRIVEVVEEVKEEKIFKCHKCNGRFTSLKYLNNHLLGCSGLRCENCNRKFSCKGNLIAHLKICGTFTCGKCEKVFNSKYKYLKHCDVCG